MPMLLQYLDMKNVSVFQEGVSTTALPTPPVIRVVLLHICRYVEPAVQDLCPDTAHNLMYVVNFPTYGEGRGSKSGKILPM